MDVALPLLLLAYPTLVNDSQTPTVNANPQDTITIPCGIRVSATGNFAIEWTEIYTVSGSNGPSISKTIENPILGPDYSLTIPSQREEDTTYTCQAEAVTPKNLLPNFFKNRMVGPATKVQVKPYAKPEIQGLSLEESNDESETGVFFILSAAGTENTYRWKKNGEELTEEDDSNIEIDPSPPTLRLPAVTNGDTIEVIAKNTNPVNGETNVDIAWAFIFLKSDTDRSSTTESTKAISTTEPATVGTPSVAVSCACPFFSHHSESGVLNIILVIVFVVCLGTVITVSIVICRRCKSAYKQQTTCENCHNVNTKITNNNERSHGSELIKIHIEEHSFTLRKDNLEEFFDNLDLVVGTIAKEMRNTGIANVDASFKDHVRKIRRTLLDSTVIDSRAGFDSGHSEPPPYPDEAHHAFEEVELNLLPPEPAEDKPEQQQTLTTAAVPSPLPTDDDLDTLAILLLSLANLNKK